MKLGPVTKINKKNTATLKKITVRWWQQVVMSLLFFQFMSNLEQSGRIISKTYIFINSNLLSSKNWKQNWKISNTILILLLWVKVLFCRKMLTFCKKNADISKIKGVLVLKLLCSERNYVCVLKSCVKIVILGIKPRFSCGEWNLH